MNRHHRTWAALIIGIIAGYAVLALLLDDGLAPDDRLLFASLLFSASGLWFGLAAARRGGCRRHSDRR
ncbi:hypothetical protein [Sandarakinorhabdus oryzae]|uniref:hypothetical protein n=1 Tax=Sandarakinorhabdus oryzae TaxID=2675220 RepID=UPI0012E114FF|nr:hypothetical protein [Sandarakinorhabdus oryzae]